MRNSPRGLLLPTILLSLLCLVMSGCQNEPKRSSHRVLGTPRAQAATPMKGEENFLRGKITAAITVGDRDPALDNLPEGATPADNYEPSGRSHSGGSGGSFNLGLGGGGGGGKHGGGRGGDSSGHSEGGGHKRDEQTEHMRPSLGSMGPPVMIHLSFLNHGAEPVVIQILDFISPLGNFAVRPDKLTLAPGQVVAVEPMSTLLDEGLTETVVTLALKINGQTEKKILPLHATAPSAPADKKLPTQNESARRPHQRN
ncbi:MAG: hypothetical protein WCI28_02530 [Opitutaceae bacterium]